MSIFRKINNSTLGDIITNELRFEILNGKIPKKTIITENQISTSYKTSRSPVREAFKTLAAEGLIEFQRMGAEVKGLSETDIHELYDVRFLIEGFCLEKLSDNFDNEKCAELKKILDNMEISAKYNDYTDFAYYDFLFHETIIKQANHQRIFYLWQNIRYIVLCFLIISTEIRFIEDKGKIIDNVLENHNLIIESLMSTNGQPMDEIVKEHYFDTKKSVIYAYFKKINNTKSKEE